MAMQTRLARLARLEGLETAQMPTVIEYHRVVPVGTNDRRAGSYVVEGNEVTFFASTAQQYEQASARHAEGRHIVLIAVDARCIQFKGDAQ